jgi:pyruvate/2-oxoglutarate dehydrogenase complex dihydrolipoamide acyltransferase (E2) component
MQQPTASAQAPISPNFASLLAALATAAQPSSGEPGDGSMSQGRTSEPAWDDDGLEDDVATLSYDRALRANTRYRSAPTDESLTQAADPQPIHFEKISPAAPAAPPSRATHPAANPEPEAARFRSTACEQNLKNASITIRMSKAESEQLRRRAAEAGLTVSAYLRSCTFEAESLRAMVKDTLSQLRSATTEAKAADPDRSGFRNLVRRLTLRHDSQSAARA